MASLNKKNLLAAQDIYRERLSFLHSEVNRLAEQGQQLGKDYEVETMAALDWVEEELKGIDECLLVLKHLLRR